MYATLVGIYSIQYIIMWCLALMENQWRDKPATAETIQKQFPDWHMEGLCDWFWLLLDFNTVHCELIDSQTSSCGLSANCQTSPCLLFLPSHLFLPHLFSHPFSVKSRENGYVELDTLDKWADNFPANASSVIDHSKMWDSLLRSHLCRVTPTAVVQILHVPSISWKSYTINIPTAALAQ